MKRNRTSHRGTWLPSAAMRLVRDGKTFHSVGVIGHSVYKRTSSLFALAVLFMLATLAYARPQFVVQAISGVACSEDAACTDDPARLEEAKSLYDDAFSFVATSIATLNKRPLVVFCSTESCYQSFGRTGATARTVGGFCIVISPRGWKPYYLRHEMIHRLQWQELGVFKMFEKPEWFIEGMAYELSEDPRIKLAEPFQGFRSRFSAWYGTIGREQLWARAKEL